jgi:hypothetical protein|tara:strand:- start:68 stop:466 length:399 start_codon:yes stop_codon:yes gene_type:complete
MLLMTLAAFDTPVENFLKRCVEVQKMQHNRTVSIVQNCILHELLMASRQYENGKRDSEEVTLVSIREKYDLEDYTIHRNAQMLTRAGTRRSKGKGWVKSANVKMEENDNKNLRAIVLSDRGREIAEILFGRR